MSAGDDLAGMRAGGTGALTGLIARPVGQRSAPPPVDARRQGFGLGAGDYAGDQAWAWCAQCDKRRNQQQVAACSSRFCKLKVAAA